MKNAVTSAIKANEMGKKNTDNPSSARAKPPRSLSTVAPTPQSCHSMNLLAPWSRPIATEKSEAAKPPRQIDVEIKIEVFNNCAMSGEATRNNTTEIRPTEIIFRVQRSRKTNPLSVLFLAISLAVAIWNPEVPIVKIPKILIRLANNPNASGPRYLPTITL